VIDDLWRDRYILSASLGNPGERAALYRGAARGVFTKVHPGVYVRAEDWQALDFDGRHLARMHAVALVRPQTVFSHLSAAILWGLPVVGGDLAVPHSVMPVTAGGRSMNGLRRHAIAQPFDVDHIGGLRVTALADTAIHIAAGYAPEVSVPVLDALLGMPTGGVSREQLAGLAAEVPGSSGSARCAWAIEFADARSGSAGESMSRVGIHRLGLPRPVLQERFVDGSGLIGITDFWWPDQRVIGEFDGFGKYLREEFTGCRSVADVVLDEKRRENRLRALDTWVARWDWAIARDQSALRRVLSDAGLRAR
jgi:hypothetical protein